MPRTYYRHPDDDESKAPKKGRKRGRGRAHLAPEPYGDSYAASAPYSMHAMRQNPHMHAPYAHPHYSAASMDAMPPWALHGPHAQPYGHSPYHTQHAPGYPRCPPRHRSPATHPPHHHDEYSQQFMNVNPMHLSQPATSHRALHTSSPGLHHLQYVHPGYVHTENHPSQNTHHQRAEIASVKKVQKEQRSRQTPTTRSKLADLNRPKQQAPSKMTKLQQESDMRRHLLSAQASELLKAPTVPAVPHRTLAQTAAFLNNPQLTSQRVKETNRSDPGQPTQVNCVPFSSSKILDHSDKNRIIFLDSPEPSPPQATNCLNKTIHPLLSGKEIKVFNNKHGIKATYDNPIPTAIPEVLQKYSELSVTVAAEPPPAHQGVKQSYPDLYTPPLAHQAPVTQMPTGPQSARTHVIPLPSPPPAHQASVPQSHAKELLAICQKKSERSIDEQTQRSDDNIIHAANGRDRLFAEALYAYRPSPETYAEENVSHVHVSEMYQPTINMYTRQWTLYQPLTKTLATTHVVYQPKTDIMVTAEAVYNSNVGVAARQMLIQPQTGMAAREAACQSSKDKSKCNQRGSARRTSAQSQTSTSRGVHQSNASQPERQTTQNEERDENALYMASPILRDDESRQNESQANRKFLTLQEYLQVNRNQVVHDESNPVTSNQCLRQARKRKTTPADPNSMGQLRQFAEAEMQSQMARAAALPSRAEGAAADISNFEALNRTLQNLSYYNQVTQKYFD